MRQFYVLFKDDIWQPLVAKLSWSHCVVLMSLKDKNEINYYINQILKYNLSKRQLIEKIKNREYERLPVSAKEKLIQNADDEISDLIKEPILIKNSHNYIEISEKILKQLILEDLPSFLTELGEGFCFIKDEYKIKLGDRYNYIDLLLYNIKFNCYVVIELKITELKKEHIGQIKLYMNYIDRNLKTINQNNTIGIIIVKKGN